MSVAAGELGRRNHPPLHVANYAFGVGFSPPRGHPSVINTNSRRSSTGALAHLEPEHFHVHLQVVLRGRTHGRAPAGDAPHERGVGMNRFRLFLLVPKHDRRLGKRILAPSRRNPTMGEWRVSRRHRMGSASGATASLESSPLRLLHAPAGWSGRPATPLVAAPGVRPAPLGVAGRNGTTHLQRRGRTTSSISATTMTSSPSDSLISIG